MVKQEMEVLFGSDAALGVSFITDEGLSISLEEYERLGDKAPDASSVFPDGSSATCCTNYARQVYKALPGRVKIYGFANEDNPTSRVALEKLHPGGHDFALVDGRYIVDPWPLLVLGMGEPIVFDTHGDTLGIYGSSACWKEMPV